MEKATERTLEREDRLESHLEAFGTMLRDFNAGQDELLTLI